MAYPVMRPIQKPMVSLLPSAVFGKPRTPFLPPIKAPIFQPPVNPSGGTLTGGSNTGQDNSQGSAGTYQGPGSEGSYANKLTTPPSAYDYSAKYMPTTRNEYATQLTTPSQAMRNPNENVTNTAVIDANNPLAKMTTQWDSQSPMFNKLMQQTQEGLSGGVGNTEVGRTMRDTAADQNAKATAANLMRAREAGMAPTEVQQIGAQGGLEGMNQQRAADMASEGIMAGRRGEALNALGFARTPAEQLGQAQIQAGENLAGRQFGAGSQYAGLQTGVDENRLGRMLDVGEAGAGRDFAGGQAAAGRSLSGLQTGMEYGPNAFKGYGAQALGSGAGLNMQDPAFQDALKTEMANGATYDQAVNKLMGSASGYYDRMMTDATNPQVPPAPDQTWAEKIGISPTSKSWLGRQADDLASMANPLKWDWKKAGSFFNPFD